MFKDPALLPGRVPGPDGGRGGTAAPRGRRRPHHRHRLLPARPGDSSLEPIDDVVIREWQPDGSIAAATLLIGRLAKGALTAKPQDVPAGEGEAGRGAGPERRGEQLARLSRNARALQSFPAPRAALRRRAVAQDDDRPPRSTCRATTRSWSRGVREPATWPSRSRSPIFTTRTRPKKICDGRWRRRSARSPSTRGPTLASSRCCSSISTKRRSSIRSTSTRCARSRRAVISTWEDRVGATLEQSFGPLEGRRLFKRYVRTETRSGLYRESTRPEEVPEDLEAVRDARSRARNQRPARFVGQRHAEDLFARPTGPDRDAAHARAPGVAGLRRDGDSDRPPGGPDGSIFSDCASRRRRRSSRALVDGEDRLRAALRALQEGRATDDPLNKLLMREGLELARYRGAPHAAESSAADPAGAERRYGQRRAAEKQQGLGRSVPGVRRALRSGLQDDREAAIKATDEALRKAMRAVASLFDDEILRGLENLVRVDRAHERLSAARNGRCSAIKVDSARVEGMVSPRPLFEIYVHSRKLEGIHLRGGKVARGGLRWSDRHDDFRTEILGLMKTQMVKNAVIVPVGSKGGFVLKGQLPPRPALDAYLVDRYREFVAGLLDVTDNIVGGEGRASPRGGAPRRRRSVSGRGRGQGYGAPVGHRQPGLGAVPASGSGTRSRQAAATATTTRRKASPRAGAWECIVHHFRHPGRERRHGAVHRGRHRRHGRRRLRQRHASKPNHAPRRRVQPPAHLHRPRTRTSRDPSPSASGCSTCHARRGPTTTPSTISAGGGIFERSAKEIPLSAEARDSARPAGRVAERRGGHSPHPHDERRPALQRRHRHVHQGRGRGQRRGRRSRQRSCPRRRDERSRARRRRRRATSA